jgi:nitroimidazol reductase NimA-like FMN-containing flavoprotein (pyridoxamine 5'-phosphate oxidase superfamily)
MATGEDEPQAPSLGRGGQVPASSHVEELSAEECWALLRKHTLGRLAIVVEGRPEIFPVNYAAGEGAVVILTQPGTKLSHGPGSAAAFEIDAYDRSTGVGWSVVVAGTLEDITEGADTRSRELRRLPVEPTAPGVRLHWLALPAGQVSGRSFRGGWMVPGGYLG